MGASVVVADGDETLRVLLQRALAVEGFAVTLLSSAAEVDRRLGIGVPDVLVLNSVLAGMSGIDMCHALRTTAATHRLPIILLVAGDDLDAARAGLTAGADDCITKPFSALELVARVKNLLRRVNPALLDPMIKVGDIVLDRQAHRVHRRKKEVRLGPTEFKLLEFLMRAPGRVYSRSEIRLSLWGDDATVDERAVDVHINRLRKGIGLGKTDTVIRTVRGAGYALGDR
ncbi:winged helix-turn-helix domain-containing protein [Pararhizobium antarcticum]|uniref:Two-component system response regulator n=1 Tax=Pararhizobium antarcticum TaxID=1798805 RepID=A0A657LNE2_9HYPH|nr:winged helix-turn-helix domain-containing protein [Pararhizobium antarcticum]OJF93320.1 two-component system response regulator [Pararhizobium antarcticum]OJF93838.1 two-component system response regulator [Rhizobium sp. 58]